MNPFIYGVQCCKVALTTMPDFPHSTNEADTVYVPPDDFYDLVVIGGGPHSLALAARLSEQFPAALYTDDEHQRLAWLKKYESESVNDARKRTTRELRLQSHQALRCSADASESVHAGEANRRNITLQRASGKRKGEPHFIAAPSINGSFLSRVWRIILTGRRIRRSALQDVEIRPARANAAGNNHSYVQLHPFLPSYGCL